MIPPLTGTIITDLSVSGNRFAAAHPRTARNGAGRPLFFADPDFTGENVYTLKKESGRFHALLIFPIQNRRRRKAGWRQKDKSGVKKDKDEKMN